MDEPDNVRYLRAPGQVVADIQEWMLRERLHAGNRLPSERELAATLRAGTNSVRHALGVLETMRVLERGPGGRHVVAPPPSPLVGRLLRLHMAVSGFERAELMSIRIGLESAAAARAAACATPNELAPLHVVVREMADPAIGYARFGELDCRFHTLLARAGHNELAALLLSTLGDVLQSEMRAGYDRSAHWRRTAGRLATEHRRILDSVEAGDAARAADTVTVHIRQFYDLRAG
ncbi:FCD domain-containing protein [Amycolatopsis acidiphila]|uniref:FadR family transcriptional regulator n=1 Tax=Amycolatopsis acidiphila TaxID=715473 RepID=A0A558AFE0_9PSEU|nr:FCD domain-containing protein [Amycolatopsis acidiphila]TVT22985.1 FadR family transcriptional regulator [Amycolatopsis acidiphila]UIJ57148.1 FCD domain-containing protein [Amycolatopsis acidiphila]GHG53065.1 GntR family transcriptional regulator [Amycolatopsis acidiphila]